MAAVIALDALGNAAQNASPIVLKTQPSLCSMASRSSALWRASAGSMVPGLCAQSLVLPSMSVKRNVTVPLGRSGIVFLPDHFIGSKQQRLGDCEPKGVRDLHVDDQFELGGLLDWQVA